MFIFTVYCPALSQGYTVMSMSELTSSQEAARLLNDLEWGEVKSLASQLEIDAATPKAIDGEDETDTKGRILKTISAWIENDPKATWAKLAEALRAIDRASLAVDLERAKNCDVTKQGFSVSERTTIRRLSALQDYRVELSRDIKIGMTGNPKWFPSKYLYDKEGSVLCEKITGIPQYYVFRAEAEILAKRAKDIMQLTVPDELVELGSGASTKTRLLIEAMHSIGCCRYAPLEISETALLQAAKALTTDYEWLQVKGQLGDFDTDLPKLHRNGRRLIAFLGNTVGNFKTKHERGDFLAKLAATMVQGDALLLGMDLLKDVQDILVAYNDESGLHRMFAMRALDIMNRELDANFPEHNFERVCQWNPDVSALEVQLLAHQDTKVSIRALNLEVELNKGEKIVVTFSTKFTREGITQELFDVGLTVVAWYTDSAMQYGMLVAIPVSL